MRLAPLVLLLFVAGCATHAPAPPAQPVAEVSAPAPPVTGSRVRPLGAFRADAGGLGYAIELWRHEGGVCGLFYADVGAPAPAVGLLEDTVEDEVSGALSFRARLSLGVVVRDGKATPSRDLFAFDGTMGPTGLTGLLEIAERGSEAPPRRETIAFRPDPARTANLKEAARLDAWQKGVEDLLRRQGPRW